MRTMFVEMHVFSDDAHGQIKVFYMEENRCNANRGINGRERERKGQESAR
jgi:hypothetical protein